MGLNWNEIKSRALLFSKTWADACNEISLAKHVTDVQKPGLHIGRDGL